jgi:hypothetical protein
VTAPLRVDAVDVARLVVLVVDAREPVLGDTRGG